MHAEARRNLNVWLRNYGIPTLLYLAALGVATWFSISEPAGVTKTVLVLVPIVPGLGLIYLGIRSYRQSDEYIRQRIEQSAALAAVVAAILALIYSFLELAGPDAMKQASRSPSRSPRCFAGESMKSFRDSWTVGRVEAQGVTRHLGVSQPRIAIRPTSYELRAAFESADAGKFEPARRVG